MKYLLIIIGCFILLYASLFIGISRTVEDREGVSPINTELLLKMQQVESSGNPRAISNRGAVGLYQIRPAIWSRDLKKAGIIKSKQCLFNPAKNEASAKYVLHHYWGKTLDMRKTLHRYSGGMKGYYERVQNATGH